jgi:hypothetical protein
MIKSHILRFSPPILVELLRYSATYLRHRKVRHLVEKNRSLKDLHKGKRCFILATGPSIKQQDLTPLKDELCISVSNFFVHDAYDIIKPAYHCIAPWHPPITLEQLGDWMKEVHVKTKEATLVLSASDYQEHQKGNWFPERKCVYLSMVKPPNTPISYRNLDCSGMLPAIASVPVMAIYLAMHFGCTPIYLLGTDHDWILHFGQSRHFYEESSHSMARDGYNEWQCSSLLKEFRSHVTLWTQYEHLRRYTASSRIQLENATQGGLLDVFPRARYAELFE